jgi:hypothetical protein
MEKKNNAEEDKNNDANTSIIQSTSAEITLPEGLTKEDISKMVIFGKFLNINLILKKDYNN